MIEENPSFGYRTVAHLLGFNKNTVQRIFQLKGWQVRKRPVGFRPRIQALPSVAKVRIPLMADSDSIPIADSVPCDGGHAAPVS